MDKNSAYLSEYLLQIKAIQLNVQNPFTWASGWRAPVYCDNRIILSYPDIRNFVKNRLSEMVRPHINDGVNCVAGVATAGIPHAAVVADVLGLPMVYVRSKAKGHGMKNTIEGRLPQNAKIIVIEDVVSTGKSSLKAVEDLREAGAEIAGMKAIYTYDFDLAKENFEKLNVELETITRYSDLISVAAKIGYISNADIQTLSEWRKNPSGWLVN